MSLVNNIKLLQRNYVEAEINTEDTNYANLFRRAILNQVTTYAIEYVIFDVNNSARHEEDIALRLGQLIINQEKLKVDADHELRVKIKVKGPKWFTSEDIPQIPFVHVTPIMELLNNHEIECEVVVRSGYGYEHAKFQPVTHVFVEPKQNGKHLLRFKNLEMFSVQRVINLGVAAIPAAKQYQEIGKEHFFRPVIS